MALVRKKFTDVPPDAIMLTEQEAQSYQTKILNNWKHSHDVFAYRYGPYVLGMASFMSGLYINSYYRRKLKLLNYGKFSTFLPLCILPGAFSLITHVQFVLRDVVLQKRGTCPVCLEMRAAALQSTLGCLFPAVLAPIATFSLAAKYFTFDIPDLARQPMKVFHVVKSFKTPILNVLFGIFIGQAFLASTITYFEAKSVITVNEKLKKLERELENS